MSNALKGLIVGLANNQSIAWGCLEVLQHQNACLAVTYQNDYVKETVESLAKKAGAEIILPMDVRNEEQANNVFKEITEKWGKLDFILHSIAFAPRDDLHGRVVDSSLEGFTLAMDVSCHSLVRLAKLAEPLMKKGGSIVTVSYYGAEKVIDNYNLMGPVKAALEALVRSLANELGYSSIRVNAISPGPVLTRAASGIKDFNNLIEKSLKNTPIKQELTITQIGEMAAFLMSDKAKHITGQTIYIDNGYSILG